MPTDPSAAWAALAEHHLQVANVSMAELFANDPSRAEGFTLTAAGLTLDYSKNRLTHQTLRLLGALARACNVEGRRAELFGGRPINNTERRAVLHTVLRSPPGSSLQVDGRDVLPKVRAVAEQVANFAEAVRGGRWRGASGKTITDVVNIGIGGSDLGPHMVTEALRPYHHRRLSMHFVANVDGAHLATTLARCRPATTLFIVVSKTFTTQETMANARSARQWLLAGGAGPDDVARHFVAVSCNPAEAARFGIGAENTFAFWDWVGGRTSVWSAVGLSVAVAIGSDAFGQLLAGARSMDEHFLAAPLERNMPVLLACIGAWYVRFFGATTHAVLPYDQLLARLPAYLQQLEMESNGKSVRRDGRPVVGATCPILWGDAGTLGQHAFYQLLHQGTHLVPCDFIGCARPKYPLGEHHTLLLANLLAQSSALMLGRSRASAEAQLRAAGAEPAEAARLAPHKVFAGNRPSNTLLLPELTPGALGSLLALYEHKVFVQGVLWDINSYDQWGVELGKELAQGILPALRDPEGGGEAPDPSTAALLRRLGGLGAGGAPTA